ncbi:MAG: hypothetical protein E7554_00135 [Ruminococcaceae bacterium]|nr:hypothetical protein [Oscillospiraceae bacterium]
MEKNNKLAMMSMITTTLGVLLMNVGHLEGVAPDWVVRVIGIVTMFCAALSIFFTVRELAKHSANKDCKDEQTSEKE